MVGDGARKHLFPATGRTRQVQVRETPIYRGTEKPPMKPAPSSWLEVV
jgi:hypothetical protein